LKSHQCNDINIPTKIVIALAGTKRTKKASLNYGLQSLHVHKQQNENTKQKREQHNGTTTVYLTV